MIKRVSMWSGILFLMISVFIVLIVSDRILLLVHPKMLKFIYMAVGIMTILFINSIRNYTPGRNSVSLSLFLIPIFLAGYFILSEPFQGIAYNKEIEEHNHIHEKIEGDQEDVFLNIYSGIQHNEIEEGTIVEIKGLMLEREGKYISKVLMSCCAADSQLVGIKINGDIEEDMYNKSCELVGKIVRLDGELVIDKISVREIEDVSKIYVYR